MTYCKVVISNILALFNYSDILRDKTMDNKSPIMINKITPYINSNLWLKSTIKI